MALLTTSLRAEIFKVSLATNRSSEKPSQSQLRIKNQGGISNRHADQRALLFNFREESNHEILPFWHLSPLNDTENILRGLWDRIYSIFLQIYALFQTILSLFGITRCGTYEPAIYKTKALCTIINWLRCVTSLLLIFKVTWIQHEKKIRVPISGIVLFIEIMHFDIK